MIADDLVGVTLGGRYRLLRPLGAGGMGSVYVALHVRLGREVAVKVLKPGDVDASMRERFEREGRALAQLKHPGIVSVFDFDVDADGRAFMAMEFVDGRPLRALVDRTAPLDWRRSLPIVRGIAAALAAAHRAGVVHRDLKPENVIVTADGAVKLLDFGIARVVQDAGKPEERLTAGGVVVGTPGYIAPESVLDGVLDDARSDLYALGVIWFELIAARPPFDARTALALVMRHATEPAPKLSELVPDTNRPRPLDDAVAALLAKSPAERPRDATAVVDLVDAIERASFASGTPTETQLVTPPPMPSGPSPASSTPRERRGNLPAKLTKLLGRDAELAELAELVDGLSRARLVTLTGPGGSGKSRLAIELARATQSRFSGGAFLVELAGVKEERDVDGAVAAALGVKVAPGDPPRDAIVDDLRERVVLIVLDNCEHVIGTAARIAEQILTAAADVVIVATSREALDIAGESAWRVPTLSLGASVALFRERAGANANADADDDAIAEICARLDGIPLAIELAAARAKTLGTAQVHARLADRFKLLTGGTRTALPRQQTLRATFDWSYALLDDDERRLLGRLSVFVGGFTLDAASAVSAHDAADTLERLVAKSLVDVGDRASPDVRYAMLETIAQYASEKLDEAGEREEAERKHVDFFAAFAAHSGQMLRGKDEVTWAMRLRADTENLRAALRRALRWPDGGGFGSVPPFLWQGALAVEATTLLEHVLAHHQEPAAHVSALFALGTLLQMRGEPARAAATLGEAVTLLRRDSRDEELAFALALRGVTMLSDDPAASEAMLVEARALAGRVGHAEARAMAGGGLARAALLRNDRAAAERIADEMVGEMVTANVKEGIGWSTLRRAEIALIYDDLDLAARLLTRAHAAFVAIDKAFGRASVAAAAALLAALRARPELALDLVAAADAVARREGLRLVPAERDMRARALQAAAIDEAALDVARTKSTTAARLDELIKTALG